MENILPIIILVVWLVYSLYNKEQKRKKRVINPDQNKGKETGRPSLLEQLLAGDLNLQQQQSEPVFEPFQPTTEIPEEQKSVFEKKKIAPKPFLMDELENIQEEGQRSTTEDEILDVDEVEINPQNRLDLYEIDFRKAVIFSEILNAPYITYK